MASSPVHSSDAAPKLCLVIPTYNAGVAFDRFIAELLPALDGLGCRWTLQVVDDGSWVPEWQRLVDSFDANKERHPGYNDLLVLPRNTGKGAAVRAGWDEAGRDADWLAFVDADGSVPAREVARLCREAFAAGSGTAVLASRRPSPAHRVEKRWHRHRLGRVFATLVHLLFYLPIHDTQCGLKVIPAAAYHRIRPLLFEPRFSFDVELLCLLRQTGIRLVEEPIDWSDLGVSTLRYTRDIPSMLWSLWRIRRRRREWPALTEPALQSSG